MPHAQKVSHPNVSETAEAR